MQKNWWNTGRHGNCPELPPTCNYPSGTGLICSYCGAHWNRHTVLNNFDSWLLQQANGRSI